MPLVLERLSVTQLPIDAAGLTPADLAGLSNKQIAARKIWFGRQSVEVGDLFRVGGKMGSDETIIWVGELESVHSIGTDLSCGTVLIESTAGRHVGSRMSGGQIITKGDVSDFAGAEMTGGQIRIGGNAGDWLGGHYPGSKFGMNRGTILVSGNAGSGTGAGIRRGVIAVAGDVGKLCGWNMLAGSIIVWGNCGPNCGAAMIRGTIVLAGSHQYQFLPTFVKGGVHDGYLFRLTATWLQQQEFPVASSMLSQRFQMHHGDQLKSGRGEVFVGIS